MSYKSEDAYMEAVENQRAEVGGVWTEGDFRIIRSKPYNLLQIERIDGTPVHKSLRGQWTGIEEAKAAIRAISVAKRDDTLIAGVSDVE